MPRKRDQPRYRKKYKGIMIDLTASDEETLEEKVRARKNAIDAGAAIGSEAGTSVAAWSEQWLRTYKLGKVSNRNYKTYESNLRLHILPIIGAKKLTEVHQYELQEILNAHADESESHAGHIKDALTGMFRAAVKNKLINANPALELTLPQKGSVYVPNYDDEEKKEGHRSLTDDEIEMFLSGCDAHYAGLMFKIIYYCGLRPQEVCALQADKSFDFTRGKETIHITHVVELGTRLIKVPKTKASKRSVPIPKQLVNQLRAYVKQVGSGLLFTTRDGRPKDTNDVRSWWRYLRNQINRDEGATIYRNKIIEPVFDLELTPYDLRHTYCTNLQRAGVPINVAKVLMGHSSIEVTARIYTHHTSDMTDAARKKMTQFNAKKAAKKRRQAKK